MKRAAVIISLVFLAIVVFFTIHQLFLGNPFRDEIPPALTLSLFLIIGGFCSFYVFSHAK
ncbi:MAG: hypothetical protein ABSG94_05200 [Brevinematales bacterium]